LWLAKFYSELKKLFAFLFLFALLVNIFGSIIFSGVHDVVHYLNDFDTVTVHPNMGEEASVESFIEEDPIFHNHGNGYHSHGFTLSFLLRSFDFQKLTSLLQDLTSAMQWMLQFPVIIEEYGSLLEINLPTMVKKAFIHFIGFYNSTDIDIPTPPPKFILS